MVLNDTVDIKQKAVIITGCSSGFGNRLAFKLNELGFQTYATVLDARESGAQDLVTKCRYKSHMTVLEMDVTKVKQIDECFEFIQKDLDDKNYKLWALVNNAGIISYGNLEWGQFDEFTRVFDVNVFGVVRVTRKFIPLLRLSKGHIVITSSIAGRFGVDYIPTYSMSKAALISFGDTLRREMNKFSIKVITIEPGIFKTNMIDSVDSILKRQWRETDASVRKVYGENYFRELLQRGNLFAKLTRVDIIGPSPHIDLVIDDMVKAVANKQTLPYYRPGEGVVFMWAAWLLQFTPQLIIDRGFQVVDGLVPAYMLKNNNQVKF